MSGGNAFDDWESAFDRADSKASNTHAARPTPARTSGSSHAHTSVASRAAPAHVPPNNMSTSPINDDDEWKQANAFAPYEITMESDRTAYRPPIRILSRKQKEPQQQQANSTPNTPGHRSQPISSGSALSDKERAYEEARRKIFGE
ncbi:hypothetical protein GGI12_001413 [Dipsacomyces acuminosporus]|nr:hypothetical protein GGI12_001413 [Dipsacomyces acuminosporus]